MDLSNAAMLSGLVFALTQYVKSLLPSKVTDDPRVAQTIAFVIGVAASLLAAHTGWGHTQLVNNQPLDTLNVGTQALVGLALGAGATLFHTTVGAVKNIGQNQPTGPPPVPTPTLGTSVVAWNLPPGTQAVTPVTPDNVMTFPAS